MQAEIELNYAKHLDSLYAKYSKPRSERGAVANFGKGFRRPSGLDVTEEETTTTQYETASMPVRRMCFPPCQKFLFSSPRPNRPSHRSNEPTGLIRDVWSVLLDQMKKRAESRQRFANNMMDAMRTRLEVLERETTTTSKRCLELGSGLQNEMQRSFKSVEEALKHYYAMQGRWRRMAPGSLFALPLKA